MEPVDERQQEEITALRSIFEADFADTPAPKAWKGAARLPEFIICVRWPNEDYGSTILFHLLVRFPKTYPTKAAPIFNIQQPIKGLSQDHIASLIQLIRNESRKLQGSEMVFQIITYCQEWLLQNVIPPSNALGTSLAAEMQNRALQAEKAKSELAAAEAEQRREKEKELAAELGRQIQVNAAKKEHLQREEREKHKARHRAASDATERPVYDAMAETFERELNVNGVKFRAVKLSHPENEGLGVTYFAEPIAKNPQNVLLELHVITFDSHYYSTNQGRKKLRGVETELLRLAAIEHENLIKIFAVKVTNPSSDESSRLSILMGQRPPISLRHVLEHCDTLSAERTSVYIRQLLSALHAVHCADLVHRGLTIDCVRLTQSNGNSGSATVKLSNASFYTKLQDLHRSDPFGPSLKTDDASAPNEGWLTRETIENPLLYTRARDVHDLGIVFIQMLMGIDATSRFLNPEAALGAGSFPTPLRTILKDMLNTSKKNTPSCISLLGRLPDIAHRITPPRLLTPSTENTKTPLTQFFPSSPEVEYNRLESSRSRQASRWREDWQELELLGKGGFGSVVKARNKIDNRTYAVKKIKLRATPGDPGDQKIFREVNALSRLSHRYIVRYYTTWLETSEVTSSTASSDSGSESESDSEVAKTVANSREESFDPFSINLDDLGSGPRSSFPSIHFASSSMGENSDSDSDDGTSDIFDMNGNLNIGTGYVTPPKPQQRTLYIQMEFVERQTLKERIQEGISEEESWRLFSQIVDALVHMSSLGILHRDIKLTNIFIDGSGNCKVGDFGLATSSLAAVDPSDVSPHSIINTDLTLEVGTKLYIAPEVLNRHSGPRNHNKADIYSLGIVFFEMNHMFATGAERIKVLEDLRKQSIIFPDSWDSQRVHQKTIITSLLQHNPLDRPSAVELSQSNMLPPRIEDEYFKNALGMIANADSPQYPAVLASLFSQKPKPARGFLYDSDVPEHAALNGIVVEHLANIFRLRGAIHMEPPLLMPNMRLPVASQRQATLLDQHGEIVVLPANLLVPFARLAARTSITRIKRYHIGDTYRQNPLQGHPKVLKTAVFDIVTPDVGKGVVASVAELLAMMNEVLDIFPSLNKNYDIHISHSAIALSIFDRIPEKLRDTAVDILLQSKSSASQKRNSLVSKGLSKALVDELDALTEIYDDYDHLSTRLDKLFPVSFQSIAPAIEEMRTTSAMAVAAGMAHAPKIKPLMVGKHANFFKDGVCFEVTKKARQADVLAAGGRYDHLISTLSPPMTKEDRIRAVGLQIDIERITASIAESQSAAARYVKEQKSFGYWTARRCDVYVASFQAGNLQERLELASLLWKHNISADVMYEHSIEETDAESLTEICLREGILFVIYPRPRNTTRDFTTYKVKSVLRGAEYEVSRQELVSWLQQQIAEQKRGDLATPNFTPTTSEGLSNNHSVPSVKENAGANDVVVVLPGDAKKQRKQTKQILRERAYDISMRLKSAVQAGMPIVAIDVPSNVIDIMAKNDQWLTDDESWRSISVGFSTMHSSYASQIREAVGKRKSDGWEFVLLYAVKEDKAVLLSFSR